MSNIFRIVDTGGPDPSVIAAAEELLDLARAGKVTDLALVARLRGNDTLYRLVFDNHQALVGAAAVLVHDLIHNGDVAGIDS